MIEHFNKARALKGKNAKFGEQLLLTNAQSERAARQIVRLTFVWLWLDDGHFTLR
jgi:hypothetical protein